MEKTKKKFITTCDICCYKTALQSKWKKLRYYKKIYIEQKKYKQKQTCKMKQRKLYSASVNKLIIN